MHPAPGAPPAVLAAGLRAVIGEAAVRAALKGFLEVTFRFESEGSKIIYLTQ